MVGLIKTRENYSKFIRNAKKNKLSVIHLDYFMTKTNNLNNNMKDTSRNNKAIIFNTDNELNNDDGVIILGIAAKPWELDPAIRKCFQKNIYYLT